MQYINDPDLLNQLEGGAPEGAATSFGAAPQPMQPQQLQTPQPENNGITRTGGGSILNTMQSKWSLDYQNILAANVDDPSLSNYARKRAKAQLEDYQQQAAKLNTAENLVAGIGGALPAIGAGIINPILGGAVAAGQGYAGTLGAQLENQGEYDNTKALMAGGAMGLLDAATGGLTNRAKAALPAAGPLSRIGINAAEDVTSNVGAQAFENMASGRNWSEGIGDAAMFGAAGGMALRGTLAGLNRAMGRPVNQGGQDAINEVANLQNSGYNPSNDLQGNAMGYRNMKSDMDSEIASFDQTADGQMAANDVINKQIDLAISEGGDAATLDAISMMQAADLDIIDSMYDIEVPAGLSRTADNMRNPGLQIGLTKEQMRKAGTAQQEAHAGKRSQEAIDKGLTRDADELKFQDRMIKKVLSPARGTFKTNPNYVKNLIVKAESDGMPKQYVDKLKMVHKDLSDISNLMEDYTGDKKTDITDSLRITMQRLKPLVNELGLQQDLLNVRGQAGKWDPITDIMTFDRLESFARARMPSVHRASPNKFKTGGGQAAQGLGNVMDISAMLSGNFALPIARRAISSLNKERKARKSQRSLADVKKMGRQRAADIVAADEASIAQNIRKGDMESAAAASANALNTSGIATGEMGTIADSSSVIDTSGVDAASSAMDSAPITPAVDIPTEVPVQTSRPVSPTRPAASTKPAPEPEAPKPKSDSKKMAPSGKTKDATKKPEPESTPEPVKEETPKKERRKLNARQAKKVEKKAAEAPQSDSQPLTRKEKRQLRALERKARRERPVESTPEPEVTVVETPATPEKPRSKLQVKAQEPKKTEAPQAEPTPVTEPEVSTKESSKVPARKPAQKAPEEPVSAPEPEASQPLPRQPKKPEKSSEGDSEARAEAEAAKAEAEAQKEAAKEPVKPKGPDFKMISQRFRDKIQEMKKSATGRVNSKELAGKIAVLQRESDVFNSETSSLAKSYNTDKDEISRRIDREGGIGKVMADAKTLGMTTHAYLDMKIRDQIDGEKVAAKQAADEAQSAIDAANKKLDDIETSAAERKKALEDRTAAEDKQNQSSSEWERKITSKRNQTRRRLDAAGYNKKIIDQAMEESNANIAGEDFDPVEVNARARTLARKDLEAAQQAAKDAAKADSDAAKSAKQTLGDSKKQLRTALKGLGVQDHPDVRKMMKKFFGNRDMASNPLSDAQRASVLNKADEIINAELEGLQRSLSRPKTDDSVELASLRQRLNQAQQDAKTFADNRSQYDQLIKTAGDNLDTVKRTAAERAEAEAEVKRLAEEARKRDEAATKIQEQSEAVDAQSNSVAEDLRSAKVDDEIIQEVLWKNFGAADKPLSKDRVQKIKNEAFRAQEKTEAQDNAKRESLARELQKELDGVLAKVPEGGLESATQQILAKATSGNKPEQIKAAVEASKKALKRAGKADHVAGVEAYQRGLEESLRRKELYPSREDRDLWVARENITEIQNAMSGDAGKAYVGNLGQQLRSITGDTDIKARYTREEIATLAAERAASRAAKAAVGDDDIRVAKAVVRWRGGKRVE